MHLHRKLRTKQETEQLKFNLTEDDLPYFRTLHSLAFRKLGLKKDQVMQPRHYKDLGKKLGFPVTYADYKKIKVVFLHLTVNI